LKARNPNEMMRTFVFGSAQYASPDKDGYISVELKITNEEMVSKIVSGEYRGLSVAWKVRKWECSIRHENLEECPHEVGRRYDDLICQMIARDIQAIELSVVSVPQDPRCRIIDMLVVRNRKNPEYIWYGFRVNTELDRFKNIQKAYERGLIPAKATFFFSKFFSINSEGKAVFP
jgi:predicted metal-binding protein